MKTEAAMREKLADIEKSLQGASVDQLKVYLEGAKQAMYWALGGDNDCALPAAVQSDK